MSIYKLCTRTELSFFLLLNLAKLPVIPKSDVTCRGMSVLSRVAKTAVLICALTGKRKVN